ncbi:MAG: hypothetical protein HY308_09160 [Gammaproteobacteria bacterium]|nr:hypothetical protein [Gammaproteobacteria bacterium]
MKKIYFLLCATSFVITGGLAAFTVDPAFKNTLNWDVWPIPEVAQTFISFSKWVFWSSIAIFVTQIIGLVALLKIKKICASETVPPNNTLNPTPQTARRG